MLKKIKRPGKFSPWVPTKKPGRLGKPVVKDDALPDNIMGGLKRACNASK